ncbi:hypothetical protein GCM10010967_29860 [Dyadobacter beijingensis]|uniref:Uncharacterized protein n=1 Tax=Dyadobacter beijingensis TaxID=365489 RepID=A0ABQ2HXK7_9BACT|nr:hypothetical protein [Dyadobacter beijingensis]GGM94579.1 hypothetical protein GCM10010967_29860 [Dyadobacter beijingensis]
MKTLHHFRKVHLRLLLACCIGLFFSFHTISDAGKGKLAYKTGSKSFDINIQSASFIAGPDGFESGKKIRRLIFTTHPLGDKIKSCAAMNCVDQYIEGIQVDLDAAPRLLYWISLNNQLVQYSGTAQNEFLSLTTDTPEHLTGTLKFDQSASGGPVVDIAFDTKLSKTFTKAR